MKRLIDGMTEDKYIRSCMYDYELDHDKFDLLDFLQQFPKLAEIGDLKKQMEEIANKYADSRATSNFAYNFLSINF